MDKREAVRLFVERDFNNIPLSLVEKAYSNLYEKILQPIEPQPSDFELEDESEPEFCYETPSRENYESDEDYKIALSIYNEELEEHNERMANWEKYQSAYEEWEQSLNDYYPMWGTIFECNDSFISQAILERVKEVQDIGFIVMDDFDELNVCLGVNGCGYDFYEAHWQPLYELLGLRWHNEE